MNLFKTIFIFVLICAGQVFCLGQGTNPILPQEFAGWHLAGPMQTSKDALTADPANAALLNEYGFTDFASATYTRNDGHKLTLRAARFSDATGAYGAFTFYKQPQMLREEIPDQAASWNERVLFYRSNILVDAVFQQLGAMSAAELRDLSGKLPIARGSAGELPAVPTYLPKKSYVKNSAKYVVGPVGLEKIGSPLTAGAVNFQNSAELALGKYNTSAGEATLVLISYPTPQIAADQLHNIEVAHTSGALSSLGTLGAFFDKRTGPIVAVVTGNASQSEANELLESVNYEANVTWNQSVPGKRDNIGSVVVGSLILAGILGLFALIFGIAFGGFRLLLKRLHPERAMAFSEATEFISLGLMEDSPTHPKQR
jgi:hypothetical protein